MKTQSRILSKNMVTTLLVIFLFIMCFPSFVSAHHHHKSEFIQSVRAAIEKTHKQLSPLTANCFSLADTDKFLRGVNSYVVGVAVDTDYLAHFKMRGYVLSFLWLQHPESGLTQPRYQDAGWGDIAFTPQEQKYSGWIILARPPNVQGDVTAFHEAIHAYHLFIKSTADADKYEAPESITNNFYHFLTSFQRVDDQLNRVIEAKRRGQPYQVLEKELERMIDFRERTFNGFANQNFFEVLSNIGGKADWKCYRDLVKQTIKNAEERKPIRLEIRATHPRFRYPNRMTLLKGQSTILKAYLVYSDNSEEEVTTEAKWAPHDFFSGGRGTFSAQREHWGVIVTAKYKQLQGRASIEVIDPRITVDITASPPGLCGGQEADVTYSIEIKNPGIAILRNVWVLDSLCSDLYVGGSQAVFPTFMGAHSTETFQCTKKISRETKSQAIVTGEYVIDRPDGNNIRGTVEDKDSVVVGDGSVSVPFVVGWNVGTAVSEIRNVGLTIGKIRIETSDTVAPGNIISQAPEGGTDACLGDKVDLVRAWGSPRGEDDDSEESCSDDPAGFRAVLDCGNAFELEPGDFAGKGCGVIVKGWEYNDNPVEVSVVFDKGSGIMIFPEEDMQHPMNMYNPGTSDYPDRYIFSLSFRAGEDAPTGLTDFIITVRQVGTGEIVLPLSILVLDEGQVASKGPGIRPPADVVTGSGGDFCVWRHKSFGDRPECFNFSRARCDNSRYVNPKYELVGSAMTWREAGVRMAQLGSYHEDAYGCHTTEEQQEEDDSDIELPDQPDDSVNNLDTTDMEKAESDVAALRDMLNKARATFMAAEQVCTEAKSLRKTVETQVDQVEQAAKKVDGTLRAADDLAAKCPDVANPENIRTLYKKAEDLTVQIGAEVAHAINNKNTIAEKMGLFELARSEAISEASEIKLRIEALYAANFKKAEYSSLWIRLLEQLPAMRKDVEKLIVEIQESLKCTVQPVDELVTRADNAYAGVLVNLGAHEGLVDKAEECRASVEANDRKYDKAMAAITACDLDEAKRLIDSMQDGDKKTDVVNVYNAAAKHESELKVMVNQEAKEKYKSCDYDGALDILNKALATAKCEEHKVKINKSIAATRKGQQLESELKVMVNQEAKGKYKSCDYDGALDILNTALSMAKCEEHKVKINKSIAVIRKGQQLEAELKVMVNQKAKKKYKACDYDGALGVLAAALGKAKCDSQRAKINKNISVIKKTRQVEADLTAKLDVEINRRFKQCAFDDALKVLNNAYSKTNCEQLKQRIDSKKNEVITSKQREQEISQTVQSTMRGYNRGASEQTLNKLNKLLGSTRCDTTRAGINSAIAKIKLSDGTDNNRQQDCSHCERFDNWLITNRRACGYHGARLPSICSADPECVSWNNRCNEVRRKKQECLSRCQGRGN